MITDTVMTYLSVHRIVGYKFDTVERYLLSYINYAVGQGDLFVLKKTAFDWAALAQSEKGRATRLSILIRFARFAHNEDMRHEILTDNIFCSRYQRRKPYIFTNDEIKQLILQARHLDQSNALRPYTYSTLFGLLACTGLRINEALSLRIQDITPEGLVIRNTKFQKSRLIWLHESVVTALDLYLLQRRKCDVSIDDHLFISHRGNKLSYSTVANNFKKVIKSTGIQCQQNDSKPHIHDLRHHFAMKALENCPDTRDHVTRHMLALSTYMGHANFNSTYWYLDSTPQLMKEISKVFESFINRGVL